MRITLRNGVMILTALLLAAPAGGAAFAAEEAGGKRTKAPGAVVAVEKLIQERDAYLGVSLAHVEHAEGKEKDGLYITRVYPGTGAAEAGLRKHDRIVSVDGRGVMTHRDVLRATQGRERGDVVQVAVLREGREQVFDVTLGGLPERHAAHGGPHHVLELHEGGRPMIGVNAITLTDQLAAYHEVPGGVLVTKVVEDGPAWQAGIRAGDVVVRWNGGEVLGMNDIHSRLRRSRAGDVAEVELIRRGSLQQHDVTLSTAEEVRGASLQIRFSDEQAEELGLRERRGGKDDE